MPNYQGKRIDGVEAFLVGLAEYEHVICK